MESPIVFMQWATSTANVVRFPENWGESVDPFGPPVTVRRADSEAWEIRADDTLQCLPNRGLERLSAAKCQSIKAGRNSSPSELAVQYFALWPFSVFGVEFLEPQSLGTQ